MREGLKDKARLQQIRDAIVEIEQYVRGITLDDFFEDSKTRFAAIKQLEIIGEAVDHVDPNLLSEYNEIEWRAIKAFRNVMVHEYLSVNLETIWNTVFEDRL